jgi:hypothetical protein
MPESANVQQDKKKIQHNTRHNNAFLLPSCASYFLPSTLKLWNSLPPEIKDCPSISILKSRLTSRVDHDKVPIVNFPKVECSVAAIAFEKDFR